MPSFVLLVLEPEDAFREQGLKRIEKSVRFYFVQPGLLSNEKSKRASPTATRHCAEKLTPILGATLTES